MGFRGKSVWGRSWIVALVLTWASVLGPWAVTARAGDKQIVVCGQYQGRHVFAEFDAVNNKCLKWVRHLQRHRAENQLTTAIVLRIFRDRDAGYPLSTGELISLLADEQVDAIELYNRRTSRDLSGPGGAGFSALSGAWNLPIRGSDDVDSAWVREARLTPEDFRIVDLEPLRAAIREQPEAAAGGPRWQRVELPLQTIYPIDELTHGEALVSTSQFTTISLYVMAYWAADFALPYSAWVGRTHREHQLRRNAMYVVLEALSSAMGFLYQSERWGGGGAAAPVAPAAPQPALAAFAPVPGAPVGPAVAPAAGAPGVPPTPPLALPGPPRGVHVAGLGLSSSLGRGGPPGPGAGAQ